MTTILQIVTALYLYCILLELQSYQGGVSGLRVVPLGGKDCDHDQEDGVKVCNGAVIREKETTVQLCVDGKLKYKKKTEVTPGYPLWPRDTGPGKDCLWYGTTFCDGDLIEDLKRWWYHMRCSKGVMRVVGRSWEEVVRQSNKTTSSSSP